MSDGSVETQLLALLEIGRDIHRRREVAALLPVAAAAMCRLSDAERAFIFVEEPSTGRPVLAHGEDRRGEPIAEADSRVLQTARQVFHDRRPLMSVGTPGPLAAPVARAPITELRLRLLVCLPLVADKRLLGVIYADGRAKAVQTAHSRVLALLADHIGIAMDNAHTFERASNDLLTGLPTSGYFLLQLGKALVDGDGDGGVVLLDLDAFCRVNQAAGTEAGDRALIDVAQTLREGLRADGLVARFGSDKFAVLLPPEPGGQKIALRLRDVAERARAMVAAKVFSGVRLSACIGALAFPVDGPRLGVQEVVARADSLLGRARSRGQGSVEVG